MHDLQTTALPAGMHDDVETGPGMVQTCLQRLGLGILTPERATHLHLDTDGMRKGRIGGLSHIEGAPDLRVRLLKPERIPAEPGEEHQEGDAGQHPEQDLGPIGITRGPDVHRLAEASPGSGRVFS